MLRIRYFLFEVKFYDHQPVPQVRHHVPDHPQLHQDVVGQILQAEGALAESVAAQLAGENGMTPVSLSMTCFLYDALLKVDREGYREVVLEDIRKTYQPMLDAGATSFWETELGEADFHGAGSLCHGWSAMPVYYYHTLLQPQPPVAD